MNGGAQPWRGQYMDGQSAVVHPVTIHVADDVLFVHRAQDGTLLARWAVGRLTTETFAEGEVHLRCSESPAAMLTTDRMDFVAYFGRGTLVGGGIPPRRWWLAAAYGIAVVAASTLVYLNLRPLAHVVASRVPTSVERGFGASIESRLASHYCGSAEARQTLASLAKRLGAEADGSSVDVVNLGIVNAFTLPGGKVVISRALLEKAESADEVAGVLAHELEHVAQRHVMSQIVRDSLVTMAWRSAVGDYTGLMAVDPKTALDVANLRFSRDDELEADRGALRRLDAAGISRDGLRSFFTRLGAAGGDAVPEWLSTHPGFATRANAAETTGTTTTPALSAEAWEELQDACLEAPEPASLRKVLLGI